MRKFLFAFVFVCILTFTALSPMTQAQTGSIGLLGVGGPPSGGGSGIVCANASNNSGSTADFSATFASNIPAGAAVIAVFTWFNSGSNASAPNGAGVIQDGPGDTFNSVQQGIDYMTDQSSIAMFVALNSAGGSATVTLHGSASGFGSNQGFNALIACYDTGIATSGASDAGTSNPATAGTSATGSSSTNGNALGSFTTGTSGDHIYVAFEDSQNNTASWTAGSTPITFTIPANASVGAGFGVALEVGTQASAGAINPAITANSADDFIAVGEGLKP